MFLEEDDEEEFDRKEIQEKDRNSLDMIITLSNIFVFIWFHRNISIRLYVTELLTHNTQLYFHPTLISHNFWSSITLGSP